MLKKWNTTKGFGLSALLILPLAMGCGAFNEKEGGKKIRQTDPKLGGTWQTTCLDADWLGLVKSRETIVFPTFATAATGDFEKTVERFSDNACQDKFLTLTLRGTFDSLPKAEGDTHVPINFQITAAEVTPQTDAATKLVNSKNYCGMNNWQTGKSQSVVDKTCEGENYPYGTAIFDIYEVNGKELRFGKNLIFLNKDQASNRPKDLDGKRVFTKQ